MPNDYVSEKSSTAINGFFHIYFRYDMNPKNTNINQWIWNDFGKMSIIIIIYIIQYRPSFIILYLNFLYGHIAAALSSLWLFSRRKVCTQFYFNIWVLYFSLFLVCECLRKQRHHFPLVGFIIRFLVVVFIIQSQSLMGELKFAIDI